MAERHAQHPPKPEIAEAIALNRANWDDRAELHARDRNGFYRIEAFRAGADTLTPIEAGEIGDIAGLRILHLQCHLGLDTLSLARRGARVTGLDFSGAAIRFARQLAHDTGLDADFVEGDVHDMRRLVAGEFDMVFASWGVLCWIPDARRWISLAASMLVPGGIFYLADLHPAVTQAEEDIDADGRARLHIVEVWRTAPERPLRVDSPVTYTGDSTPLEHSASRQWIHPISSVVGGVIEAGLGLDFLREHDRLPYQRTPSMEPCDDGSLWRFPAEMPTPPLALSIKARRGPGLR
jgi:2-polyprenyl-3-methyl-5-hydroxy-6-metoxy-1,4-benzoquinol methylase